MRERHKVVTIGGGFGGLSAAQHLKSDSVEVTLIDRRNYHLFQPLLYQVATGSLSPGEIASPLRGVLSRQKNIRVWLGTVQDVDPGSKRVFLADGEILPYDSLIVAAGSETAYYGHNEWALRRQFSGGPGALTPEQFSRTLIQSRRRQSPGRSQPWNLIARGFGLGTSAYPGFRFLHRRWTAPTQLLSPLFNQPLPTASK